jgi:hypothetical protein
VIILVMDMLTGPTFRLSLEWLQRLVESLLWLTRRLCILRRILATAGAVDENSTIIIGDSGRELDDNCRRIFGVWCGVIGGTEHHV